MLLLVFVILSGVNYGYYLLQPDQTQDWILNRPTPYKTGFGMQLGHRLPTMAPGPLNQFKNEVRSRHMHEFNDMIYREIVLVVGIVGIVLLARRR